MWGTSLTERDRTERARLRLREQLARGFERPHDSTIWQMDMLSITERLHHAT